MKDLTHICKNCLLRVTKPLGFEPVAFDYGSSDSNTNSAFRRKGIAEQTRAYSLPSSVSGGLNTAYTGAAVDPAVSSGLGSFLQTLLNKNPQTLTNGSVLDAITQIQPGTFSGSDALTTILQRNPFSTNWEDATTDLYNRSFDKARAAAQSGPTNVRGGQARQAFEMADLDTQQSMERFKAINEQGQREAGIVEQAAQIYQAIESMRRGQQMQAQGQQVAGETAQTAQGLDAGRVVNQQRQVHTGTLALAAEMLGIPTTTQKESYRGAGRQEASGTQWNAGISCCFILLEALNGQLPDYVRKGRDEFVTKERALGYRWMARWLVPAMRRSRVCRHLVNLLLVKPFLVHGKAHYSADRGGFVWTITLPVCWAWIYTWQVTGTRVGNKEKELLVWQPLT